MRGTTIAVGIILILMLLTACAPRAGPEISAPPAPGSFTPAEAPPVPEGYNYVDGVFTALQVNGQTTLVITTPQGEIKRFGITEKTRFEIDGTPCGMDILVGHTGWELSIYYWEGSTEAESVIVRSHPGWAWEATLIVEAVIIPGPPEATQKGTLKVKVADSVLKKPVPEAAITLHVPESTPTVQTPQAPQHGPIILGSTNEAGELIRELNPSWQGTYIIRAKKGGYNPGETEIDFSASISTSRTKGLPALVMPEGKPVVVSQEEIDKSPEIEMVDILISINGEALFIVLADDSRLDPVAFSAALAKAIGQKVDTVSLKPFLWLKVQGMPTRDEVVNALGKVGEELRWLAGRACGWGNYW